MLRAATPRALTSQEIGGWEHVRRKVVSFGQSISVRGRGHPKKFGVPEPGDPGKNGTAPIFPRIEMPPIGESAPEGLIVRTQAYRRGGCQMGTLHKLGSEYRRL